MKRLFLILAAILAVLAVLFALGPRASVDVTLRPVALPEDLDGYLAQYSSAMRLKKLGTRPSISLISASTSARGRDVAIGW